MALEDLFRRVFRRISSAVPTVARGEQKRRVLDEAKRILADEVIGRKRVENELAATEDKYRSLVENSVAGELESEGV